MLLKRSFIFFFAVVGTISSCKENPPKDSTSSVPSEVYKNRVSETVRDTADAGKLDELFVKGLELSFPENADWKEKTSAVHTYIEKINANKTNLIAENKIITRDDQTRFEVPFENIFAFSNLSDLIYFKVVFKEGTVRNSIGYYVYNNKIVGVIRDIDQLDSWTAKNRNAYYYHNGYWVNLKNGGNKDEAAGLYKSAILALKIYND